LNKKISKKPFLANFKNKQVAIRVFDDTFLCRSSIEKKYAAVFPRKKL
jgi:hypothetical protein